MMEQSENNGYDQLEGKWLTYYKAAQKFVHKALPEDREDLLDQIMLNIATADRNNGHKPDNPSWMYRIASFTVAQYWRDFYYRIRGAECGRCSIEQRKKCEQADECLRAVKVVSMDKRVGDSDGRPTTLRELIADNKAVDLDEWLDIKVFFNKCPQRLKDIIIKRLNGIPLITAEHSYLQRFREKEAKEWRKLLGCNV